MLGPRWAYDSTPPSPPGASSCRNTMWGLQVEMLHAVVGQFVVDIAGDEAVVVGVEVVEHVVV